jgi:hypothetical protein
MIDALDLAILDSMWQRIQWDFLEQTPLLSEWLEGSQLRATPDPDVFKLIVINPATVDWLGAHTFAIRRSLSQELRRPVEVRVVAVEGVGG